ncbi:glycosyltransferase family 87 protein [Spirillospora sp. NBC_01491]|uniref:glycosyltransferase family 87 protein n=1 Tax=Spirillospora sp. NBC_01491 TaxID=2976007 RepID=UPI002E31933C|nr:glycosyltransferase family 87 protein [Spirillospora sp. NBC_01491]
MSGPESPRTDVPSAREPVPRRGPLRRAVLGTGRFAVAHLLFAVVLAGAIAVRVTALRGYPMPLWSGDSYGYLGSAVDFSPHIGRPSGYSVFLRGLEPFHDLTLVAAVQAGLGAAAGVMVYALVWRHARAAWSRRIWLPGLLAAPASVPVLYDGNLVQAEHMLLADSLFTFLLVAAVTVVLWRRRVSWWTGALAGLIISCAALTRLAGLPFLAVIAVAMLLRWSGWKRTLAALVAAGVTFAVPFAAYMTWFERHHGAFALSKADKVWLYGRTVGFADCAKIKPPPELQVMCPKLPRTDLRVAPAFDALWGPDSPFKTIPGGIYGDQANTMAGEFADMAIKAQPGDYLNVVVHDTLRAFEPGRDPYPTPWTEENLRFPAGEAWSDEQALLAERYGGGRVRVVAPYAEWIRDYQGRRYTPGPVLGVLLGAGLLGVLVRLRPRSGWGGSVLLPWSLGAALVVIPAATADFDYRYIPPAIPFACLAAALAIIPGARTRTRAEAAVPAAGSTAAGEMPEMAENGAVSPADASGEEPADTGETVR